MTINFKAARAILPTNDDNILDGFTSAEADDEVLNLTWGAQATPLFAGPRVIASAASAAPAQKASSSSNEPSVTPNSGGASAAPAQEASSSSHEPSVTPNSGGGFVINATIGSGAPAGFASAVDDAIRYFEDTFTNNLTMNITFDCDDDAFGGLAATQSNYSNYSYSSVVAALQSRDPGIAADAGLVLPSSDPFAAGAEGYFPTPANTLWLTNGEATSLGLSTFNSGANTDDDATIYLDDGISLNFDPTKGGVAGDVDVVPILEHEIWK